MSHTLTCPLCAMRRTADSEFLTALIPTVSLRKAYVPASTWTAR